MNLQQAKGIKKQFVPYTTDSCIRKKVRSNQGYKKLKVAIGNSVAF
jgi:hypothetical protein